MFPFKKGELSFQFSEAKDNEENNIIEDLVELENNASIGLDTFNINKGRGRGWGRGRGRKSLSLATSSHSTININDDNFNEKKIIHREVERQRRHEMSNLYSSLCSMLPADSVKGKKLISDHVGEAVNYIKYLEKNVKELGEKRDELQISANSSCSMHEGSGSSNSLTGNVEIRQFEGGLQIEISVGYEEEFSLSSALQVAFEEGLNVSSCSSTKISDKLLHNLICEVSDISCIDVNRLQQRLVDLVC